MPFHHRVIHFFMAVCFMVTASCAIHVATTASTGTSVLLWILALPVIATAAHGLSMAFSHGKQPE